MAALARIDSHAITGVVPPQLNEAMIREVWATVDANAGVTTMARKLIKSIFLAPLGWFLLAPLWVKRFLGFLPGLSFLTTKYTVTNRRVMIRKGMKARAVEELPLDQIGDVKVLTDGNSDFYSTGHLQILRKDSSVAFTMLGVPEPESFRQSILQAATAWGPLLKSA
jgi:hypothetical protein